jgi:hypothetical protein
MPYVIAKTALRKDKPASALLCRLGPVGAPDSKSVVPVQVTLVEENGRSAN